MMSHAAQPQKQYLEVGDRIIVRSSRQEMTLFVGKPGTVVAVFDAPRGSCLVRMDTGHRKSDLFVYRTEISDSSTR